jgi:predicted DsbA family dithiol-disulfide isomerase
MKVEIWSDVMCPFCYIGKRKFEKALEQFPHKNTIEVVWKSFQLDPSTVTDPSLSTIENLAHKKGWSKEQANETVAYVSNIAKQVGLTFNFEKAVVANSFDAHRLSHLAKKYGKQNELEEKLFAAYFTEGKNTADYETLLQIGTDLK